MNRNRTVLAAIALGLLFSGTPFVICASDHMNLDDGYPLQVEDAYPTAYRNREAMTSFHYEYTRQDEDRVLIAPQIEYGAFWNTELTLRAPFYMGEASRTGSGDIELEALYNFNTETICIPALALEGTGIIPTGKDSDGFDTAVRLILTKSISTATDRIHLNGRWMHNAAPRGNERENRYQAIVGYSRRIAPDWLVIADFIRQQDREKNRDSNILELGLRCQVTPLTVISFGAGAGIGRESPKARALAAVQKSF